MPEIISRGRFAWHELMTTDPVAATRFYPKSSAGRSGRGPTIRPTGCGP